MMVSLSDLGEDSGTSITNCAAQLATLIVRDFELDPATITEKRAKAPGFRHGDVSGRGL